MVNSHAITSFSICYLFSLTIEHDLLEYKIAETETISVSASTRHDLDLWNVEGGVSDIRQNVAVNPSDHGRVHLAPSIKQTGRSLVW